MPLSSLTKSFVLDIVRSYGYVQNLNLSNNEIEQVENLEALSSISTLNLANNKLSSRNSGLNGLRVLTNLRVLDLSGNNIEELDVFGENHIFSSLERLSLSNNCISKLFHISHLQSLPNLKVLHLTQNPIASVPNYRFKVLGLLPNIEDLDGDCVLDDERSCGSSLSASKYEYRSSVAENSLSVDVEPSISYADSLGLHFSPHLSSTYRIRVCEGSSDQNLGNKIHLNSSTSRDNLLHAEFDTYFKINNVFESEQKYSKAGNKDIVYKADSNYTSADDSISARAIVSKSKALIVADENNINIQILNNDLGRVETINSPILPFKSDDNEKNQNQIETLAVPDISIPSYINIDGSVVEPTLNSQTSNVDTLPQRSILIDRNDLKSFNIETDRDLIQLDDCEPGATVPIDVIHTKSCISSSQAISLNLEINDDMIQLQDSTQDRTFQMNPAHIKSHSSDESDKVHLTNSISNRSVQSELNQIKSATYPRDIESENPIRYKSAHSLEATWVGRMHENNSSFPANSTSEKPVLIQSKFTQSSSSVPYRLNDILDVPKNYEKNQDIARQTTSAPDWSTLIQGNLKNQRDETFSGDIANSVNAPLGSTNLHTASLQKEISLLRCQNEAYRKAFEISDSVLVSKSIHNGFLKKKRVDKKCRPWELKLGSSKEVRPEENPNQDQIEIDEEDSYVKLLTCWRKQVLKLLLQKSLDKEKVRRDMEESMKKLLDEENKCKIEVKKKCMLENTLSTARAEISLLQLELEKGAQQLNQAHKRGAKLEYELKRQIDFSRKMKSIIERFAASVTPDERFYNEQAQIAGCLSKFDEFNQRLYRAIERIDMLKLLQRQKDVNLRNSAAAIEAERRVWLQERKNCETAAIQKSCLLNDKETCRHTKDIIADNRNRSITKKRRITEPNKSPGLNLRGLRPECEAIMRAIFCKLDRSGEGRVSVTTLLRMLRNESNVSSIMENTVGSEIWSSALDTIENKFKDDVPQKEDITWGEFLLFFIPRVELSDLGHLDSQLPMKNLNENLEWLFMLQLVIPEDFDLSCDASRVDFLSVKQLKQEIRRLTGERSYLMSQIREIGFNSLARTETIYSQFRHEIQYLRDKLAKSDAENESVLLTHENCSVEIEQLKKELCEVSAKKNQLNDDWERRFCELEEKNRIHLMDVERKFEDSSRKASENYSRVEAEYVLLRREHAKISVAHRSIERELERAKNALHEEAKHQKETLENRLIQKDKELSEMRRERNTLLAALRERETNEKVRIFDQSESTNEMQHVENKENTNMTLKEPENATTNQENTEHLDKSKLVKAHQSKNQLQNNFLMPVSRENERFEKIGRIFGQSASTINHLKEHEDFNKNEKEVQDILLLDQKSNAKNSPYFSIEKRKSILNFGNENVLAPQTEMDIDKNDKQLLNDFHQSDLIKSHSKIRNLPCYDLKNASKNVNMYFSRSERMKNKKGNLQNQINRTEIDASKETNESISLPDRSELENNERCNMIGRMMVGSTLFMDDRSGNEFENIRETEPKRKIDLNLLQRIEQMAEKTKLLLNENFDSDYE